ncbi:helix-turn-helix domain-containing protein [Enterococcus sp. HY326]|uniref:helix-turn-helix domain-containing protein n=1 Tax=Enterococcus sp. HY326 TaxID=2971265 RepID=UPI00223FDE55|nr:AraC family transcriptional regulator [Enterococcus sp. HY326]
MKGKYQYHQMKKSYPIDVIPHEIFLEEGRSHESLSLHWHRSIELVLVQGDPMTVWKEGKHYLLSDGDLLFINSQESHEFIIEKDRDYHGVTVIVAYDFLQRQIADLTSYYFSFAVDSLVLEKVRTNLWQLLKTFQNNQEWNTFQLHSLAGELLFTIFSDCIFDRQFKKSDEEEKYSNRYKTVIRYINEHFFEPVTLSEVAELVHLNPDFFSRNFKQYIGVSFKDYLKKVRLNFAINLMLSGQKNLADIALESGFPDQKSFIKAFKESYQETPSNYRKNFGSKKKE